MSRFGIVVLMSVLVVVTECRAQGDEKPYGLEKRKPWTTSRVVGSPEPPPPYTVQRIWPKLKFEKPVFIAEEPGTDRVFVAELGGKIFSFSKANPKPESKKLFLDIKRQIYAFSFHTKYEQNGHVFVFSPTDPSSKEKEKKSRVSRFQTTLKHPRTTTMETEKIIFEWLAGGHNGGEAIMGPDGYLYISTGDSTGGSDPKATGQGVDDFLSVIVRLDVDNPDDGKAYSVPKDNPFVNYPGAKPEIWAHGFRNPWRLSFDRDGNLWCGDVGQDLWEMIWRVEKGGNYGWSVQEGSHPFHPNKKQGPGAIQPPIVEHHHTESRSITGGYVYYGDKHPDLKGAYFYGDHEYGLIWSFKFDGKKATEKRLLADTALHIPTFGVTREGEILVVDHPSGEIYELVKAPASDANKKFPRRLSQTGLLASVKDHTLADGVVPYSVNAPQWIDNGTKQRFVGLPGESKIKFGGGTWGFEDGTVAAETISLEMEQGNPKSSRRIETRILIKQQNHWLGYSYLWNAEQTDADLVEARGRDIVLNIRDKQEARGTRQQTWHVPSRNECMFCHSRAATFVLGLKTDQLNKDFDYGKVTDNQLRALDHAGVFKDPIKKKPTDFKAIQNPYDNTGDIDARARAYLHVNCSICHVSDGGGNAKMVLGYATKIGDTKLLNEKPMHGTFGLDGASLVTPGDPFASVLFYRLSKVGRGRMPHVGSKLTDPAGLELMHDWILQLTEKDEKPKTPPPQEHPDVAGFAKQLANGVDSALVDRLLSTSRGAFQLARFVDNGELTEPIKRDVISRGVSHPDTNVRDLFERFVPEQQRTKRLGDIVDARLILDRKGSADRGRQLFLSGGGLQCRSCHSVDKSRPTVGADLSQIGKKYKRAEILESLIDPSKKIDPKFVTQLVVTTEGKVHTGILAEKTDQRVVLNVFRQGKVEKIKISADDVDEILPQKKSLMPDRQLRDLTAQQAADLLEFLMSLK